jgi:hypothetical protein
MVTSYLKEGTKNTTMKRRNVCDLWMVIHTVNTDLMIMPGRISHNFIIVNNPSKHHLKQLYPEWLLAGHYVLTPARTIRKPNIELLSNRSLQK